MPRQTSCARCQSVLQLSGPVPLEELTPPRAGFFKSFRPVQYALNRVVDRWFARADPEFRSSPGRIAGVSFSPFGVDAVAPMVVSIVPGAGHIMKGRWLRGLLFFAIWLVLIGLLVSFYVGVTGVVLFLALILFHVFVVMDAGLGGRPLPELGFLLRPALLVLALWAAGYGALDWMITRRIEFVESMFELPARGLHKGDTLLVKLIPGLFPSLLERGDMVVVHRAKRLVVRLDRDLVGAVAAGGYSVGPVVALPGETLELSPDGVKVNGELLDPAILPGGSTPLPKEPIEFQVSEDQAVAVFSLSGSMTRGDTDRFRYSDKVLGAIWTQMFFVGGKDISGKVWGIYLPLSRRRFF
jgi:hypothetical protein